MKIKLLFIAFFAFIGLNAQEITDYDLQNFARAYHQTMKINGSAQKKMAELIADEKLDLDVYHAIFESKNSAVEPDLPQEEYDKFERVQPEILKLQQDLEQDIVKMYGKFDLNPQKYRAIAERVKQDYLLQAKLEKMMATLR
ncbi:MAG TPA: DUF4168 domain-containing protein [Moheibacter sp.]|nr:DUF4168 domain-containing protein [Moheibacter sp.]